MGDMEDEIKYFVFRHKKVQVGNDQEKAQSETKIPTPETKVEKIN